MECTFSKSEIRKFWSQIVEEKGVDYYTPEEWQEHYTDFCRCMLSESEPFTRIDTLEELSQGIVKTQPVFLNQSIIKNPPKVREETPMSLVEQPFQPSQHLLDKFNEQWKQRDMSQPNNNANLQTQRMQGVRFEKQNNPQQFKEQQWTSFHSQHVVVTQRYTQQQPSQQKQQQPPIRPATHEFRIPRVPHQAPTPRFPRAKSFSRPPPPVSNFNPPGEVTAIQEIYEQSRVRKPLSVSNINADVSKINSVEKNEDILPPKKKKLEIKENISLQKIYEQSRVKKPLVISNINADISKISSEEKKETKDMLTIVTGGKGEIGQEVKMSLADGYKKVEPIDDWLQNFTDKSSIEIDHEIADTSDFFNNLPNPTTVIGKTSQELIAVLNNINKSNKAHKKSKKKRNKNKSEQ
ncbi:probable basic-leucine zipper transcription factor R [Drosophila innubila]|uniref:probable basic-leucine zipper transcription factor R n=1 Tax=Drosophila innubila TaxID=198719 RepID=UPI00148E106D|nr:probable basic-leucine zipper transcription factor R [Drosophila innubila]